MPKDYYKILGVDKKASTDDIKRAFRKLSHQYHPDKGGNTEKFKEINEAYQVLSDSKKRQHYDQFGSNPPGGGQNQGFGDFDFSNFSDFKGGGFEFNFGGGLGDIFDDFFGSAFANIQAEIRISVIQAVLGDKIPLRVGQENLTLNVSPGTQDQTQLIFRGKGRPHRRGRGDLIMTIRVIVPNGNRLSRAEKRIWEELKSLRGQA